MTDLNNSEVLIVFKLNKLSGSCSKRIIHFNYLNKATDGEFLDLYLKSYSRKFCFERKSKSEMKLNPKHLFELATLETNAK